MLHDLLLKIVPLISKLAIFCLALAQFFLANEKTLVLDLQVLDLLLLLQCSLLPALCLSQLATVAGLTHPHFLHLRLQSLESSGH